VTTHRERRFVQAIPSISWAGDREVLGAQGTGKIRRSARHLQRTGRRGRHGAGASAAGRKGARGVVRLGLAVAVLSAVGVASSLAPAGHPAAAASADWPVYHGSFSGAGVASGPTTFDGARKAWTSRNLHGQIFGEPLVVGNDVVVATEDDDVYALNAADGAVLWSKQIARPVPANRLPCGDIRPKVGITSTPVVDTGRSEVFVVADEWSGNSASHHLVGLDLATGDELLDQVVDPAGTTPTAQLQRDALTLDDGNVIVAFGGNAGDCSTYNGWIVATPESGGSLRTFEVDPSPGNDQGAVWMGGAAPVIDGSGDIWFASGNGSNTSGADPDYSDSVVELSSSLAPLQTFTPSTWQSDNASDADLGSSNPAVLPDGLVLQAGKSQTLYVLDGSSLGGVGGQESEIDGFCGADVDGGDAFDGDVVYLPCGNGVTAVQASTSPPGASVLWTTSTGSSGPAIVADGLIWTIGRNPGTLYGLDPGTGSPTVQFHLGAVANHFPTPSVGDGLVLAASSSRVHAFTLEP